MKTDRKFNYWTAWIVAALLLILPMVIAAEETSGNTITSDLKSTIDQVKEVLNDEKLKNEPDTRRTKLRHIINKRFNYDQMAVRALAENWPKRTDEEKKEFTRLFTDLLERTYAKKIESFDGGEIHYLEEVIKGKYAMVKTKVENQGKFVSLDYKLVHENGEWKVYDFIVTGASMIRNYRNQFSKVLKDESFADLIEKMENSEANES